MSQTKDNSSEDKSGDAADSEARLTRHKGCKLSAHKCVACEIWWHVVFICSIKFNLFPHN